MGEEPEQHQDWNYWYKTIKLEEVPRVKSKGYAEEKALPDDGLYLYLPQAGEEYGDQKRRATYAYCSKKTYRLGRIVTELSSRVLYYLEKPWP